MGRTDRMIVVRLEAEALPALVAPWAGAWHPSRVTPSAARQERILALMELVQLDAGTPAPGTTRVAKYHPAGANDGGSVLTPPVIILSPHPDDEVLGCAGILAARPATVVHITDGVPPWTSGVFGRTGAARRVEECEAAWRELDAKVRRVPLHYPDARTFLNLTRLVDDLASLLIEAPASEVLVPAYERGHPDHDAVHVAAQLARQRVDPRRHRWIAYSLYSRAPSGTLRFGSLSADYPRLSPQPSGVAPDLKIRAIRQFASQIKEGSILFLWLQDPAPEAYGELPEGTTQLPEVPCLYERWVTELDSMGPDAVDQFLRSALVSQSGVAGAQKH